VPEPDTPLSERPWEDVDRMVSVDDALARVLAAVSPLSPIEVPILEGEGLVVSEDIVADADIPPFRNSAMDGYAVQASDTAGASSSVPLSLRLIGSIAAGFATSLRVSPGTAVRVMTGAVMPEGADAVVRFEETDESAYGPSRDQRVERDEIGITRPAKLWDNVRPAGEDVRRGSVVIANGTALRPPEIGLLAALNHARVKVHRRPRVAILSTGDEVIDLGPELEPGQIRNSNSYTLAAMAMRCGAIPIMLGVARDTMTDLTEKLTEARSADLIVTSGGVSLGDYDMVKDVLQAEGSIAIWQVRMKPGKPLAFGEIDGTPLLGLPGNPVAAAVSFEQFARPAIKRMLCRSDLHAPCIQATLTERIDNRGHRRHYVRALVEADSSAGFTVRVAGDQGAGVLTSLARANGLLVLPEHIEVAEPGMRLPVQMIDWYAGLPLNG
jgi:molybdopterin molybdotransferase